MISEEAALMLVISALYLYDSMLLLATNEAVLVRVGGGRWFAAFGWATYRLARKEPYFPNPLTPFRRQYVLSWSFESTPPPGVNPAIAQLDENSCLDTIGHYFVIPMGIALFVFLPLGLFTRLGTPAVLAAVVVFYASAIAAMVRLHLGRRHLVVAGNWFIPLAFQCFVCPPFALNLVRKLCALTSPKADYTVAAAQLLRVHEIEKVKAQCLLRLEEQIDFEPEGTPRMEAITSARSRFQPREDAS
ncbi:hypothetical protein QTH97_33620 [Variovorax sp. J22R24]|uniref:hypothetical protein n=1 Tax=Variovorax gracilis TaxID=3053502 RepID=UPI0025780219|nr:hypothetical protein [Variovorax sp. J22R24]MDM0109892.1 hypothetical protein [Variovorax sp. J22R24]